MSNERLYFPYQQLEEYQRGMWRIVRGEARKRFSEAAADLMRDAALFKDAMREALNTWPISCSHNLTAENTNRLAWLGHAGCCIRVGSCEENTRIGWHMLSPDQQAVANRVAAEVLTEWSDRKRHDAAQADLFNA
jgi:hypothetical protein